MESTGDEVEGHDDDDSLFELDDEDMANSTPLNQAMDEVHEVVNCLLRFSMALRNPARHDMMRQAATIEVQHFRAKDREHTEMKCPNAPVWLVSRLQKVITGHRQYFKYRESHHNKLAEGLDDDGETEEQQSSTVATSIRIPDQPLPSMPERDWDAESIYTATSFAPSDSEEATLRPPSWPEQGRDGEPFECPICFRIVVADTERSWR